MASPTPMPPYQQPARRRSIFGPLVLIALGIVFLLTTMGVLDHHRVATLFAQYWPVLLILAGVVKLVEHEQAKRSGVQSSGLGGGGIFLMILLICFGLAATAVYRVDWQGIADHAGWEDDDFPFFGKSFTYDDKLDQDFPAGGSLRVLSERGAVNITISEDNKLHLVVHKRVRADNQSEADKRSAATKPRIAASANSVTVDIEKSDDKVRADLDISVPRGAPVTITSRNGDISVMGRDGDVDVTSQKGDISVADIKGKVNAKMENGTVRITQVSGDVTAQGRADNISVEDIKGSVRLNGEFAENVRLGKITRTSTFKSSRTDMEFSKLDGDLDLDSGDLQASGVTGPLRISTRSKDIRLSDVSGDVRLENEDGAVELRMLKLGSVQLENRRADIELYVPDKAGFQITARARDGEVESDFTNLNISTGDSQSTAAGTVGGGGPQVVINNEHGGIQIRKRSSLADANAPPKPGKPPKPDVPEESDN